MSLYVIVNQWFMVLFGAEVKEKACFYTKKDSFLRVRNIFN